jgi:2-methylcitrate dehydratase PrpD
MDALRECLTGVGLAAADVAAVNVETYADALRFCDRPLPQDEAQARFSIQHALAAWLLWGEPRFEHYAPAAINDPALAALRARVQVQQSDEYQSRYPAHYGARVRIECHDGRVLSAALSDCWGDPARPMPDAAVRHKAQRLMAHAGWAPQRIAAALAATEALPLAADLIELENALQP